MNFRPCSRLSAARRRALVLAAGCILFSARESGAAPPPVYTVNDCVDLVPRQNPDVLTAAKQIDAARAGVTQARAQIFPTLSTTDFYQKREQNLANEGGLTTGIRTDDYNADIRLSQNVFSSFAVRNRIKASHLGEQIAALNYQAALNTAASGVREAFYTTLAAEASIAVRQQAIDLLAAQLKDQQDRFTAGSVGQINVNRAQVALANEQPPLLEARANIRTAYAALAQLLGIAYPTGALEAPFRVRGALEVRPFPLTQEECIQRALVNRPEVEARLLALDVLKHQLVVEQANNRPQVSLFAAYDVYSEPIVATTRDSFSGYTLGVNATWNIFDGFATLGRVRGVRAQQGEAAAQLVAIRLQVETDVRNAFDQLRTAEATLRPQSQNITMANETLNLTNRNFDAGLGTQLDVLQDRVELTRAQTLELGGRLAYNLAVTRLNRAMAADLPRPGVTVVKSHPAARAAAK